ncbi:MAG: hypothetical protein HYW37_00705 [Candidatus Colwellbacteria bacterium]|nr:hypothetical protein [Candidatus Colwellbacteria bacterium]
MRFWLKTTRPNVGPWKDLPLGPLGLILGVVVLNSVMGGMGTAGLAVSASGGAAAVLGAEVELRETALLSDLSVYGGSGQDDAKPAQSVLILADKSSLIASPSVTKLARRR